MQFLIHILKETWNVTQAMAPLLLFGFLISGILKIMIAPAFVERHLGGRGFGPVFRAALLGLPMPLCSCGVLPVAASLRKHGASKGATLAFLVSTPQTGVDCILATQALLGPVFVIFSIATTLISGFLGGAWLASSDSIETPPRTDAPPKPKQEEGGTLRDGLRFGLITLPQDIGRSVLIGIAISGVLTALVPAGFFEGRLGPNFVTMLLMLVVGIPMYVCSSGSIPIAYAFIQMGVSPGAALVFLVTGPATNAAALATVWKILGRRACVIYLSTIAGTALAAGLLMDWIITRVEPAAVMSHVHAEDLSWWHAASAVVLIAMLLPALRRKQSA